MAQPSKYVPIEFGEGGDLDTDFPHSSSAPPTSLKELQNIQNLQLENPNDEHTKPSKEQLTQSQIHAQSRLREAGAAAVQSPKFESAHSAKPAKQKGPLSTSASYSVLSVFTRRKEHSVTPSGTPTTHEDQAAAGSAMSSVQKGNGKEASAVASPTPTSETKHTGDTTGSSRANSGKMKKEASKSLFGTLKKESKHPIDKRESGGDVTRSGLSATEQAEANSAGLHSFPEDEVSSGKWKSAMSMSLGARRGREIVRPPKEARRERRRDAAPSRKGRSSIRFLPNMRSTIDSDDETGGGDKARSMRMFGKKS